MCPCKTQSRLFESSPPSQRRCSARGCGKSVSLTRHVPVSWGNGLCNYVNKSETNFGLLRCNWRWEGLKSPSCLPESEPRVLPSQGTVGGSFPRWPWEELAEGFMFELKLGKTPGFLSFMGRFLLSVRRSLPGAGQARR